MTEETQEASLNIPRGIIGSYVIGAASGLLMLITFCFCYANQAINSPLTTTSGYAFMAYMKPPRAPLQAHSL